MSSSSFPKMFLALFLMLSPLLQVSLGEIICEELPQNVCAFSISSSGKRCLLENSAQKDGPTEYLCRTSEVVVEKMAEWIETDECVWSCGVDRNSVGISSDSLMEPQFTAKLCSTQCYHNCPNIIDLYFNLAAGEGVFLPHLCEVQRSNPHRTMVELLSSGVAPGPMAGGESSSFVASPPSESFASAPASI
ncbi:uncharacterized protein LOC143879983 [Tasmannia lanceolata]|uniref:uncharacterized protein LOC143879983 n=1 Tax=Tasmannia lanceolata TaxID=3420 RepID=UPI004062AB24